MNREPSGKIMRIIWGFAAVAALLLLDLPASQAYIGNGPWCAFIDIGTGSIFEDCQYRSVEECRPNVLAGNRGTCNPNPRWEGWSRPAEPRRHGKRRARPH